MWEGHNNLAEFVLTCSVKEPKFKFFLGLGAGFLSSHVSIGNLDDHENGLCGRLGNLLYEHVEEVNNDMLCNWGLN